MALSDIGRIFALKIVNAAIENIPVLIIGTEIEVRKITVFLLGLIKLLNKKNIHPLAKINLINEAMNPP